MKRYLLNTFICILLFTEILISKTSSAQVLPGVNPGCPNKPPIIKIINPVTGNSFNAGINISFLVQASDADGKVIKVEFYERGRKLGEDSTAPFIYIGEAVEAGNYILTAKATDNAGACTVSDSVVIDVAACTAYGNISAEGYRNSDGAAISDIMSNPSFPDKPDVLASLNKFEYGPDLGNQYAARVRGYICAPKTGNYTFNISGDDQVGLWLSKDDNPANKVLIAFAEGWTSPKQWNKFANQKSAIIKLIKGARYYVETLHKQYVGPNHLAVAWTLPDGKFEAPIPGNTLSPFITTNNPGRVASTNFNLAMANMNIETNSLKSLKVTASPNPSHNYFSIITSSNNNKLLTVTITDVMGRVVETRNNIIANGTLQLGSKLSAGIYFVEVIQGQAKERLKLVKQ